MNKMKQLLIQKMFLIHKYLCKLDNKDILQIKNEYEKIKDKHEKEIINEYIKFRRKNQ